MVKAVTKYSPRHVEAVCPQFQITLKQKLLFSIGIPVSVLLMFLDYRSTGKFPLLFCLITAVLCVLAAYMKFLNFISDPERAYRRSAEKYPNMVSTFIFDDDRILTSLSADGHHGDGEYKYEKVESVCKKDGFFVVRLEQNHLIIFSEDEITIGSSAELAEIFSRFNITADYGNL